MLLRPVLHCSTHEKLSGDAALGAHRCFFAQHLLPKHDVCSVPHLYLLCISSAGFYPQDDAYGQVVLHIRTLFRSVALTLTGVVREWRLDGVISCVGETVAAVAWPQEHWMLLCLGSIDQRSGVCVLHM
jgi:hypothetical protein